ncbi:MAG: hypothetical protein ACKOI0_07000, partial [Actinomycetota bacterium]
MAAATVASPVGRLVVAATERGIARIAFDDEPADRVLEDVAAATLTAAATGTAGRGPPRRAAGTRPP